MARPDTLRHCCILEMWEVRWASSCWWCGGICSSCGFRHMLASTMLRLQEMWRVVSWSRLFLQRWRYILRPSLCRLLSTSLSCLWRGNVLCFCLPLPDYLLTRSTCSVEKSSEYGFVIWYIVAPVKRYRVLRSDTLYRTFIEIRTSWNLSRVVESAWESMRVATTVNSHSRWTGA